MVVQKDNKQSLNDLNVSSFSRNAHRRVAIIAGVCAAFIFVCSVFAYKLITNRLMKMSLDSLNEISLHNEQAMEAILEGKWNTLEAIASHISMQTITGKDDLLARLSTLRSFIDCLSLVLVSNNGSTAGANFVLSRDEDLLAACRWGGRRFVRIIASPRATTQGHTIDMVYGVAISPIEVDGIIYTHIVARTDIDSLQEGLKLDCYNGRGRMSIIDTDGSYIARSGRNRNPQETDNFFDIAAKTLPRGWTMERLHGIMDKRETFQVLWGGVDEDYLVSVIPMTHTSWYFYMKAPASVFMEQSQCLLNIILVFMALSIAIVTGAGLLVLRWTEQMLNTERQHRESLSEALSLADQASKAKTTFLNNMSHDMRTPMNAIIGYTALASSHLSNKERVKDYLSKISQSSDHLLSLINDVLDMSRIEAGKVNIEEKPESLPDILHHVRNIVLADIHSKSLDLFIDTVDVRDENIICDRLHLTQILLNLMGNAMKFTPAGGTVSLKVTQVQTAEDLEEAARQDEDKESKEARPRAASYEFRVRDTGIGMSREFITKVFEPFARERSSTVSGIEGTGLGLSITHNLVDMMGGTISLKSEKGKGSEFIVKLRFRLHGKEFVFEPIPAFEGVRALVVDDDVESCQGLSQILRKLGLRGEWTPRGLEAVVRMEEAEKLGDPYKLYIVDWLMPDMNGMELARRIRRTSKAPIIMLSAYDAADMESEAKEAGITDFMSKPLFATEVHEELLCLAEGRNRKKSPYDATLPLENEVFRDSHGRRNGNAEVQGTSDAYQGNDGGNAESAPVVSKKLNIGHGERLLLVEDNELNREIASEILREASFEVETANDGTDAVSIMESAKPGQYAAILMDVQMPKMDGYEATRRIRALDDPLVAAVPIIALTANVFEEDKEKAFAAGMDEYMCKPISPAVLLSTLQQIVSKPVVQE